MTEKYAQSLINSERRNQVLHRLVKTDLKLSPLKVDLCKDYRDSKNCDSSSMDGNGYLSGMIAWFTFVNSAHIRIAPLDLCAMTMLQSQFAASTCFTSPSLTMRLISSLTFGKRAKGTRRCA